MQSRDFCYWLQGYFELAEQQSAAVTLSAEQTKVIRNHLNMVFAHEIDPVMGDAKHQTTLSELHAPLRPGDLKARC